MKVKLFSHNDLDGVGGNVLIKLVYKIVEELKISNVTVRQYLKNGNDLKLCDYTVEESMKRGRRK